MKKSTISVTAAAAMAILAGTVVVQNGTCTLDCNEAADIAAEAAAEVMADDDSAGDDDCAEVAP
ncbi:hypothetical protein H8E07_09750 [bacterium]|nr:hypothetical protein [bacterium]